MSRRFRPAYLKIYAVDLFDISCTISFKLANSNTVDEDKNELSSNFSDPVS
jgi:hypothetical protein